MNRTHRWALLDRLAADRIFAMPSGLFAELGIRLREAVQDKNSEHGRALADQLSDVTKLAFAQASDAARAATQNDEGVTPAHEAYMLGQLGFAYQMAAGLAEQRAGAEFETMLESATYQPYLQALFDEDLTGVELAEHVSQRPETVSRNLQKLREAGIVDYRRDQVRFINFLTPAARHLLGNGREKVVRTRLAPSVVAWTRSETRGVAEILRGPQTFAQESEDSAADQDTAFA